MYVSPRVSTDWGGHVGPNPDPVDLGGGPLAPPWPAGPFGANSIGASLLHLLGGSIGRTDFTRLVWPKFMARRSHGGRPAVLLHRNVAAKPGNCPQYTINTPYVPHCNTHTQQ
jgi:hypothetical protein